MKTLTYEYDKMLRVGQILNQLTVVGVNQARLLTEVGNILDSGAPGEITVNEDGNAETGGKNPHG